MRAMFLPILALALTALPARAPAGEARDYEIGVTAGRDAFKAGEQGTWEMTITPRGDRVLKGETPLKVLLRTGEGIELGRAELGKADLKAGKDKAKVLSAPFTARKTGEHTIAADATFYLCNAQSCNRYKETVKLSLKVE
jgi:hypothetical protein